MPFNESRRLLTGELAASACSSHPATSSRVMVSVRAPMGTRRSSSGTRTWALDATSSASNILRFLVAPLFGGVDAGDGHLRHAQIQCRSLLHAALAQ